MGWQTGRWGDDLDDGDTCGLGAIAIFSPGYFIFFDNIPCCSCEIFGSSCIGVILLLTGRLDNMSVLLAVRPAGEEGFKLWTKVHRGERSQVVVPSGGTEDFRCVLG